jgi:hypothetical protein
MKRHAWESWGWLLFAALGFALGAISAEKYYRPLLEQAEKLCGAKL